MKTFSATLLFACLMFGLLSAQGMYFDPTFGDNGFAVIPGEPVGVFAGDRLFEVFEEQNGRLVAMGTGDCGSVCKYTSVLRTNPDGSIDTSFGDAGFVKIYKGVFSSIEIAAELQADSKILVGHYDLIVGPPEHRFSNIYRLDENGSIDSSFHEDGKMSLGMYLQDITMQADNKILMSGNSTSVNKLYVARVLPDGFVDESFAENGHFRLQVGAFSSIACTAVQPNGKILALGKTRPDNNSPSTDLILLRLNEDGSFDESFADDGIFQFNLGADETGVAIELLPDGKMVIAGQSNESLLLLKLNHDGTFDDSFHDDGILISTVEGHKTLCFDMVVENEEIIVAGGVGFGGADPLSVEGGNSFDFWVGKYDMVGEKIGYARDSIFGELEVWRGLDIQDDGKILTAGYSTASQDSCRFTLARYLHELGPVATEEIPETFSDISFYPNPTPGEARLEYSLAQNASIRIELFDLNGKRLLVFANDAWKAAGNHVERIDFPSEMPSGIYILRIRTEHNSFEIKVAKY